MHLTGDIDISTLARTADRLGAVGASSDEVVVDLQDVAYIDSQGVRLLYEFAERLRQNDVALAVVAPPGCFAASVLRIIGFDTVFTVLDSLED